MIENTIIKAFLILAASVLGIWVLFYFLKKITGKYRNINNPIGLQVISKVTIHPKTHLFVVKAGSKFLLIGASDHSISTLADLTEEYNSAKSSDINKTLQQDTKQNKLMKAANTGASTISSDNPLSFRSFIRSNLKRDN